MSDRELTQLLDRAVHHAPRMHLDGDAMLAAGRGRVRRRRAVGAGGVLGAVALAGALWFGPGGTGALTGVQEIRPATTVWEQGETVEGTLFTGLQTVDQEEVGHSYVAELSRTTGDGPVTLVLSDGGDVVEEIQSTTPVPGLDVFAGERMTVAVWREPDGVEASVPLVGPHDPGGLADVQHAQVGGEELAYTVWSADVAPLPEQVVDVYLVGRRAPAASLSGVPVQQIVMSVGGQRVHGFADAERGVLGYLPEAQEPVLLPIGDRPAQVFSSTHVDSEGVEMTVAVLPAGAEVEGFAEGEGDWRTTWGATPLLDRPLVLVVREDASSGETPDLAFTLGGGSWTLSSYVRDLRELDLDRGTSLEVTTGDGEGQVALWRGGASKPEVTFVPLEGEVPTLTQRVAGSLVTVVRRWETGAGVLTESRVEVTEDGTARWVEPTDVAQVSLPDGQAVTLLSVPAEPGVEVTGVGTLVDGEVERPRGRTADGSGSRSADASAPPTSLPPTSFETADGTTFTLHADGSDVVAKSGDDTYRTTVHPVGGPLATLLGEGRPVYLVPGWDLASADVARLGAVEDGETTWIRPVDVASVRLEDGTSVVLLVVPLDELDGALPEKFGEVLQDGTVKEVRTGSSFPTS